MAQETNLTPEQIERLEGLVNNRYLSELYETVRAIIGDLEKDGFSEEEIKAFIKLKMEGFLYI